MKHLDDDPPQVRTSHGSSLRSPPLTVKTSSDQTELEQFRNSLGLDDINASIKKYAWIIEENSKAISVIGGKLIP